MLLLLLLLLLLLAWCLCQTKDSQAHDLVECAWKAWLQLAVHSQVILEVLHHIAQPPPR